MKIDRIPARGRAPLLSGAAAICAAALASGCMGSPTYGTDKTANQQLMQDLGSILSVAPKSKGSEIAYTPRPELVRPASLEVLPEPQQALATAENPAWPESPEERRARLRAEATENQDDPNYRSPIIGSSGERGKRSEAERNSNFMDRAPRHQALEGSERKRAEVQRRLRESKQGEPTTRKYLSEPPLDYRAPAETAVAGELGEDELVKERRRRQAASKGGSWRDYVPWL